MDFFEIVFDYVFVIQLLTVCALLIIIFYPIKKTWKSALEVGSQLIVLFIFGTLLNWGLFQLSHVVVFLRGINFPISWLFIIFGYLLFIKYPAANKILMGGTMFVTTVTMICLGRQLMYGIENNFMAQAINIIVCVFIILYGLVLHNVSLKKFIDLPPISAVMMFIITVFLSLILFYKEYEQALDMTFGIDWYYVFVLVSCYIISICSYLMLYRKVEFKNEILDCSNYQGIAVVNYTDIEIPYTRIIEHKHFEFDTTSPKTVISKEYSSKWKKGDEPYYPLNDDKNNALYQKYRELSLKEKNIYFGGRLGLYKYYDMDDIIDEALKFVNKLG